MYNYFKALNTDIVFNVLYIYIYILYFLFYIMYYIHIVKRFRAHCGFYAIENKLLLLLLLSPNLLLNDCCFKIIVDTRKTTENFPMTKVTFLHHFCCRALAFSYPNI